MTDNSLIYGLVLSGGYSSRMGNEKSNICYHGKPHSIHTADLISEFCDKTFLSYRKSQKGIPNPDYPIICDTYDNIGPMSGLLSAMELHPTVAWLLMACDMPYIDKETISHLIDQRNGDLDSTSYWQQSEDGSYTYPEPLISIYEPKLFDDMITATHNGSYSLSRLLRQASVKKLNIKEPYKLQSVNTPEDMEMAKKHIAINHKNH